MDAISAVDVAALAILGLAVLRGLWIGLIREVFSLAGLAAAAVAVRFGTVPAADWLMGALKTCMGSVGARTIAEFQMVELVIAPEIKSEGKVFQKTQAIGMCK